MKVLGLTRYAPKGASSRYRFYQYLPALRAQGIEVTVAPLLDERYLERRYTGQRRSPLEMARALGRRLLQVAGVTKYDLIWVEGEFLPWFPPWAPAWLAQTGVPYVVDYDDALFHAYDLHQNPLVRTALGQKIDKVMRQAALVVAGNGYIADRARRAGAPWVEVVPTVIDLARYPATPAQASDTFKIGWIGTPFTARYLQGLQAPLATLSREGPTRLIAVGVGELILDGVSVETVPWADETEVAQMERFDVGVMPLPDSPWERGKCGFKLIQYMACGRPVIGSPVGVNRRIIDVDENGFLASTDDAWLAAFRALRDAPDLRVRMGAAGRARVEQSYCVQQTGPYLAELLIKGKDRYRVRH